jgi:ankyrin repeat protein
MLIDRGADLNIAENHGFTPLHLACDTGHESVVRMLIDGGADLNLANRRGRTPLHAACRPALLFGREAPLEIIRMLILNGADTQARDSQGRLPAELLQNDDDEESRAIYEEAVEEMKYGDLKPVLK